VDGIYEREWRNFKRWVDDMRRTDEIQEEEKYLTRLNVDLYFQQVIAVKGTIEPKTVRRVVAALQCMARREEGLLFQIDNGAEGHVFQVLQAQTQRYALRMLLQNDVDAHANLPTNSMDEDEFKRAINFVMENNKPYASDFILSLNGCTSTFARNDSLRKFNFEGIYTDKCHGLFLTMTTQCMPWINGCCLSFCSCFCTKTWMDEDNNIILLLTRNKQMSGLPKEIARK
jgi:hypothetical protein